MLAILPNVLCRFKPQWKSPPTLYMRHNYCLHLSFQPKYPLPSPAPFALPNRSPVLTAPPRVTPAPATPLAHDCVPDHPMSPASLGSNSPVASRPRDLLGRYPEDNFYIRKPRSVRLNPPHHSKASSNLARITRELVAAARDHDRDPSRLIYEARKWVARFGPFDIPYQVVRPLTVIVRFCVLIWDLTAEWWSPSGLLLVMMFGIHGVQSSNPQAD